MRAEVISELAHAGEVFARAVDLDGLLEVAAERADLGVHGVDDFLLGGREGGGRGGYGEGEYDEGEEVLGRHEEKRCGQRWRLMGAWLIEKIRYVRA